ncbi:hypothetical protein KKE60_08265 [Patescibacteria group bacterium]|uniref:Putative tail protein n=1 Tax=viral metagenome TaxID=1070528 RepID=A0A6M3MGT9_9ZZZZ|nr:hypothetical protein [Patescibacteria group bacterium]
MTALLIYDSTKAQSIASLGVAYTEYNVTGNTVTVKDTAGLSLSTINTWIGTLSAAAYGKICVLVDTKRVENVAATGVITFSAAGAAGDICYITAQLAGGKTIVLGSHISAAGTTTAEAVLAKTSINAGTVYHGFSADNAAALLTVTAPLSVGALGNKYVLAVTVDNTGTLAASVTTTFAVGATGVTAQASAKAIVTITVKGAAGDICNVNVTDNDSNVFTIGSFTCAAASVAGEAALMVAAINNLTAETGFFATNSSGVVTISAPISLGTAGNTYVLGLELDNSGSLAATVTTTFVVSASGVAASTIGSLGDFSQAYFLSLEAKVTAAAVTTGTAAAGAAGTITLAAAASATDDYYNGMAIMLDGGTGANQCRVITDYNGTTKVATISGDYNWGTTPDNTSTYIISDDLSLLGRTVSSKYACLRTWEKIQGTDKYPAKLIQYMGGYTYPLYPATTYTSTATSGTSVRIYDTGQTWTVDAFIGYYVAIKSGTGEGQVRKITSNTATYLVVATWTTNPDKTSVYQISPYQDDLLLDIYLEKYLVTELNKPSSSATQATAWKRLLDYGLYDPNYRKASEDTNAATYQDLDYLRNTVLAAGKVLYENSIL